MSAQKMVHVLQSWTGRLTVVLSEPDFMDNCNFSQDEPVSNLTVVDAWRAVAKATKADMSDGQGMPQPDPCSARQHLVVLAPPDALAWLRQGRRPAVAASPLGLTTIELLLPTLRSLPGLFDNLSGITSLDLRHCSSLTALPASMDHLCSLKNLNLAGCKMLTVLPESLGTLVALTCLDLSHCKRLTALPESIGSLVALVSLDLGECSSLAALPASIGLLAALTTLKLGHCKALTALPESICRLPALTKLNLGECGSLMGLPVSLGQLSALKSLNLSQCNRLTALPESMGQLLALEHLDLFGCERLTALPTSLANLQNMPSFDANDCSLIFPPQPVAEQGFVAIKAFFQACSKGISALQHDRLMLLGDGGAGKTTLAMALRLRDDYEHYIPQLRARLRHKLLELWDANDMRRWLLELDPREHCKLAHCCFCPRLSTDDPAESVVPTFASLHQLAPGEVAAMCPPACPISARVRACMHFLSTASFDLAEELKKLSWMPAHVLQELLDTPAEDFYDYTDTNWATDYGINKQSRRNSMRRLIATHQSVSSAAIPFSSPFDFLRSIPHVTTRGVELMEQLHDPPMVPLDFAGQAEYFPVHRFLLAGSNIAYLIMFDASYGVDVSIDRLSHWLEFVGDCISQHQAKKFGGLRVALVATHTDTAAFRKILERQPNFFELVVEKLQKMFADVVTIHATVFSPAYGQPDGGLEPLCAHLREIAMSEVSNARLPTAYMAVYGRLAAMRQDELGQNRVPMISLDQLRQMVKEADLDPDSTATTVVSTLSAYGFLLEVADAQSANQSLYLIDPLNWLTMVLAEFLHPFQAVGARASDSPVPFLTTAEVQSICRAHLQLSIDQVFSPLMLEAVLPPANVISFHSSDFNFAGGHDGHGDMLPADAPARRAGICVPELVAGPGHEGCQQIAVACRQRTHNLRPPVRAAEQERLSADATAPLVPPAARHSRTGRAGPPRPFFLRALWRRGHGSLQQCLVGHPLILRAAADGAGHCRVCCPRRI